MSSHSDGGADIGNSNSSGAGKAVSNNDIERCSSNQSNGSLRTEHSEKTKHMDTPHPCNNKELTSGQNELARSKYISNRIASDEGIEDGPNEEVNGHKVPALHAKGIPRRTT